MLQTTTQFRNWMNSAHTAGLFEITRVRTRNGGTDLAPEYMPPKPKGSVYLDLQEIDRWGNPAVLPTDKGTPYEFEVVVGDLRPGHLWGNTPEPEEENYPSAWMKQEDVESYIAGKKV